MSSPATSFRLFYPDSNTVNALALYSPSGEVLTPNSMVDGTGDPAGFKSKVLTFPAASEPLFVTPTFADPAIPAPATGSRNPARTPRWPTPCISGPRPPSSSPTTSPPGKPAPRVYLGEPATARPDGSADRGDARYRRRGKSPATIGGDPRGRRTALSLTGLGQAHEWPRFRSIGTDP